MMGSYGVPIFGIRAAQGLLFDNFQLHARHGVCWSNFIGSEPIYNVLIAYTDRYVDHQAHDAFANAHQSFVKSYCVNAMEICCASKHALQTNDCGICTLLL